MPQELKARRYLPLKKAIFFIACNYYRISIFAVIIIAFYAYPVIQVNLVLMLNFLYVCLLVDLKPYKSASMHNNTLFNEFCGLLTNYCLLCFTNKFVIDGDSRDKIGLTIIGITMLNFLINFIPILIGIKDSIKRYFL